MPTVHELRLPRASQSAAWRRFVGTVARSLYAGVFVGMIAGFVTLLISILTLIIGKLLFDRMLIDPPLIYREIAPAIAVIVAVLTFIGNFVWERTHPAPAPAQRT